MIRRRREKCNACHANKPFGSTLREDATGRLFGMTSIICHQDGYGYKLFSKTPPALR